MNLNHPSSTTLTANHTLYLSPSPSTISSFLSLSLSLTHTHTHTNTMAMMKPNPLPLLLVLHLLFLSLSTAAPDHTSPPQCETSSNDEIGHGTTSFSEDPTAANDLTFPEPGGLGPDPTSSSTSFPDETGPLPDNPDENFMFPPSSSPSPSPSATLASPPLHSLTDDVNTICSLTEYFDLCVGAALSNATGPINGPLDVLRFEIFALANATRAAFHKSHGLYMSQDGKRPVDEAAAMMEPFSKGPAACLVVCNNGYEEALQDLETAQQALVNNDKGSLGSSISALFQSYSSCGDAFTERGEEPLMEEEQAELMKLASICMSIVANYFSA